MRRMSTYSRVRLQLLGERLPVPALGDLRAGRADAEQHPPAEIWSSVAAVIAVIAGVRPGIWKIAEPILIVFVFAASQASTVAVSEPYASAAQSEW